MHQVFSPFSVQAFLLGVCLVQVPAGVTHLLGAGEIGLNSRVRQTKEEEAGEAEKPAPPGRQNPVLREYFRKEYLSIRPSAYDTNDPFLEMFVDQRIDDYLERLETEVESLKQNCQVLQEMAGELSRQADLSQVKRDHLRRSLAAFEESSDRLRKMVARILLDLDSKSDFRPPEAENMDSAEIVREMGFLISRAEKALDQVEQFFFSAGAVVHFADLQNQNMLIFLYEANRTAREMRKRL